MAAAETVDETVAFNGCRHQPGGFFNARRLRRHDAIEHRADVGIILGESLHYAALLSTGKVAAPMTPARSANDD